MNMPEQNKRALVYGLFPSLQWVRSFSAVAELESISRAAVELNLSQSAVAQAIVKLEAYVDAVLFERRNKGSYLTALGIVLKRRVDAFFDRLRDALGEFIGDSSRATRNDINMLCRRVTRAQILALIAIKESGSFLQAARLNGVSQPAIHRSARTLEDNLGLKVFYDTAHGATTNKRGSLLADRFQLAVREFEWASEELEAEKGLVRGRILVGGLLLAGSSLLTTALSNFNSMYPDASIDVTNGSYDMLLDSLRTGALDFVVGFLRNPAPSDEFREEFLVSDPYVIAVRKDHPLARKKTVTRDELAGYDWVLPGATAARRTSFDEIFAGLPSVPRTNIKTFSFTIIVLLLAGSNSMTILTQSQLALDRRLGHNLTALNYLPIGPSASIGVTTRKDWSPTNLQNSFLECLRSAANHPWFTEAIGATFDGGRTASASRNVPGVPGGTDGITAPRLHA